MPRLNLYIILALWAVFTWWTVRRLWQPATTRWEEIVYRDGVRRSGFFFWLALAIASPLLDRWQGTETLGSGSFALDLIWGAVLAIPFALWFGYWSGRGVASFMGESTPEGPPK